MLGMEIHFDTPARAVIMAADLVEGLHVIARLHEGRQSGVTLRVVVPDDLGRMLREVATIHGGTLIRELALCTGADDERWLSGTSRTSRRRPTASA